MIRRLPAILLLVALTGCGGNYYIKENLAPQQIVGTAIQRKPAPGKLMGFIPRYDDYLEGYVRGGLNYSNGKPAQGVVVKVQDEKGREHPGFQTGVTDSSGVYKVPFSLPVRWKRIDFTGSLMLPEGWKMVTPSSRFRIYFDRRHGVLLYAPLDHWATVKNEKEAPPPAPAPAKPAPKKKADDDFGFGDDGGGGGFDFE